MSPWCPVFREDFFDKLNSIKLLNPLEHPVRVSTRFPFFYKEETLEIPTIGDVRRLVDVPP